MFVIVSDADAMMVARFDSPITWTHDLDRAQTFHSRFDAEASARRGETVVAREMMLAPLPAGYFD